MAAQIYLINVPKVCVNLGFTWVFNQNTLETKDFKTYGSDTENKQTGRI